MTAITTTTAPSPSGKAPPRGSAEPAAVRSAPPSATEDEARSRFVSELAKGVRTLLARGHGRERASAELLDELADGCSPNEDEIFQTMESLGISLEDATRVMTVSSAFRQAKAARGGSAVEAIDDLTSRLHLAGLSHPKGGRSRSPSPAPSATSLQSTPSNQKLSELARNESADSLRGGGWTAKKCQRPARAKSSREGRGRKRALTQKTPENGNVLLEEPAAKKKSTAAVAELEAKEKMLHAKLSQNAEGKKARAKSPEGPGARGKRTAAPLLGAEEAQSPKRTRTRSQTEESIPAIL